MAEEKKSKKYEGCLECKHEEQTGHRHVSGHTCVYKHELGHEPESEKHYHRHLKK